MRLFTNMKSTFPLLLILLFSILFSCSPLYYLALQRFQNEDERFPIAFLAGLLLPPTTTTTTETPSQTSAIPTIAFQASQFTFTLRSAITDFTPTVTGSPTSCVASPSLPGGLSINNTTCVISGTPTANSSATEYSITARNGSGEASAKLTITINFSVPATNWTARVAAEQNSWQSVAFGNGIFVAVSSDGTGTLRAMISTNGISWTIQDTQSTAPFRSVVLGNNRFVAIAPGNFLARSTNALGTAWEERPMPNGNNWNSVTFGTQNGTPTFIAVSDGADNRKMARSITDGQSFTDAFPPETTNTWTSVAFGNSIFVAIASSGVNGRIAQTTDNGTSWLGPAIVPPDISAWQSIIFSNSLFVAVSTSGTSRVMTSSDGTTWTLRQAAEANGWRSIAFGNGTFVAVANNGTNRVMTSID